jgi:integration host factor subunit beta
MLELKAKSEEASLTIDKWLFQTGQKERGMNKSQLIKAFADQQDISLDESQAIVDTFFEEIKKALLSGDRVEIRGFGSFKIKEYEGYVGRNPSTGEKVNVRPKRLPFFKVGKSFREMLNSKK